MADNNEEEYLDALLKSMLNSDDGSTDTDTPSNSVADEFDSSEDDDMAMLTRMLMDDNNIPFDDEDSDDSSHFVEPIPIEHSDMESFLSLDDLLNSATNNESGDVVMPEEEPEITPIQSEEPVAFSEPVALEEEDAVAEDTTAQEEPAETIPEEDLSDNDFFGDFDEIGALFSNESTSVNEEALRRAMIESDEPMVHDSDLERELADILALDEGMSISDIPDEQPEEKLSEEELFRVQGIESPDTADTSDEDAEEAPKKGLMALFGKKAKKEKKEKEPKAKKEKKAKPSKPKKEKTSFKDFISQFDDEEDNQSADNNQKLIDELYKDKNSLDDVDLDDEDNKGKKGKKAKKEKKAKTPKAKKQKAPKEPKEPKAVILQEKIHIGKIGGVIITLLIIVFLFGGFFGVRFINYQLTINSAKKYFEMGNYDMAYNEVSGIDIMDKDKKFYNQLRTVMIVYQGYESYNNYIELKQEAKALDALINAVGRKQQVGNDALLYEVEDEVNAVYEQILSILEFYEIDEQMALDMYIMTNYDEYYETLMEFEGVAQ